VLEDGKIRRVGASVEISCNVRVIAATNRDPMTAVEQGRMRRDLFYRLDVLRVDVPPLRERRDDLAPLVDHFLRECVERYGKPVTGVEPSAWAALLHHDWPGNVRELRNVIERAYTRARGSLLSARDLDVGSGDPERDASLHGLHEVGGIVLPHGITAAEAERILILETLRATGNNKAEAARRLGLDVKTIRNKLKAFAHEEPSS
jgi:DNA-binding NtrC family response regulator